MISDGFMKKFGKNKNDGESSGTADVPNGDKAVSDTTISEELQAALLKITELEEKNKELEKKYIAALAEVRNTLNRTDAAIAQNRLYASEGFIQEFVDPFENLMIVLGNLDGTAKQAVEMVIKKFFMFLDKQGVVRIDPTGQQFDHDCHEAISMEKSDGNKNGTVLKVVKAGYKLHDRVVSPALVVVVNNG